MFSVNIIVMFQIVILKLSIFHCVYIIAVVARGQGGHLPPQFFPKKNFENLKLRN